MDRKTKRKIRAHTEDILEKVNHAARETHKRHITVRNRHGESLLTFPATLGIVATLILPVLVCIGLIAFLMSDHHVSIHKREDE